MSDPLPPFVDANVERPAPAVAPTDATALTSLLTIVSVAAVVAALSIGQDVLIPIVLAVMVSFILSPVVTALGNAGLSRLPSVIVTVLLTFGFIALAVTLLANQASALATDAPRYAETIQRKIAGAEGLAATRLSAVTRLFSTASKTTLANPAEPPPAIARRPPAGPAVTSASGQPVPIPIANDTSPLLAVRAILEPVLGPLETILIVLVIAIFILMEREDLRDRFIRLVGSDDLHRTTAAMNDAAERLSRYFLSQLAVNTTFGLVIGVGLWIIGIPSAALWGVLGGLLRFVPYIGAILAAVVPLALGAAIDEGWWRAGEVAALFVVVEPLTAYVVEPLLYGHSTGLAPISVIVAAVFWTWIWGPIGLILSTPLTLCFVVLGRHVKSLEFFDVLLGDRPALAPSEAVYQRILSDNPDDVLEKAERFLSERTLLEYYDQVVLPALQLAADDEARGVIPAGRAAVMTRSMLDVIADLAEHQDVSVQTATRDAGESSGAGTPLPPGRVACVAGHGAFDNAVAAMLSQLLERAGVPSRPVPYIEASRERIAALDLAGVSVVAISYLDLKGPTATLRYLVRRIRQHAPDTTIIVGLWPAGETDTADTSRQASIGADLCVASLREAVEAACRAAQGKRGRPA